MGVEFSGVVFEGVWPGIGRDVEVDGAREEEEELEVEREREGGGGGEGGGGEGGLVGEF